jgi:hypothetical protein
LPEGMQVVALQHAKEIGEFATLREAVSSTAEFVLGRSPNETFRVEVMDELVAEFWRLEWLRSRLEHPFTRICDLLLGPPLSQARWADRPGEAIEHIEAVLALR